MPDSLPSARIICDSINDNGQRVVTAVLRIHRFVLSELNTHKVISKNSASSRAIPVQKQIDRIINDPAVPIIFPAEKPGMQGGERLSPQETAEAREIWLESRDDAVAFAKLLSGYHVHKSVTNRILEPYMWHEVVITATSLENFFLQRVSKLAQPEFFYVARELQKAYWESRSVVLQEGEWHLPFIQEDERHFDVSILKKISAARCARVSYLTHEGTRSIEKDLELYEKLVTADPFHGSPLEHVCTPDLDNVHTVNPKGTDLKLILPKYANLLGWQSLRIEVEAAQNYQSFS